MKLNYSYDLPFGRGRQFLGAPNGLGGHVLDGFIGGWGIAGITVWDPKGVPVLMPKMDIGVTAPGAALRWSLANSNYQKSNKNYGRAVYVRGSFINPDGAGIMNHEAFSPTPDYSLSNAPFVFPNLRAPGDFSTDATLLKKFQLGDNAARYLETRIEATNVFNHPTYGTADQNTIDADPTRPPLAVSTARPAAGSCRLACGSSSDFPGGAGHSFPAPHFFLECMCTVLSRALVLAASLSTCFGAVAGAQTASLATAQTMLRVKAGATAPQLLSLQTPGKAAWSNTAAEDLIATAEEDGQSRSAALEAGRAAHSREMRSISRLSTSTQSPHLRLTWEWSAPAATGPLEHRIRIENLDTRAHLAPAADKLPLQLDRASSAAAQADLHRQRRGQAIRHRHA